LPQRAELQEKGAKWSAGRVPIGEFFMSIAVEILFLGLFWVAGPCGARTLGFPLADRGRCAEDRFCFLPLASSSWMCDPAGEDAVPGAENGKYRLKARGFDRWGQPTTLEGVVRA